MCGVCGCEQKKDESDKHLIHIEESIMAKNNAYASNNKDYFLSHGVFTLNLLSSPGSGKTSLLELSLKHLKSDYPVAVIEGDQQTQLDAQRINALNVPVKQINTGKACHLDAHDIGHAVMDLQVKDNSILFIENVGNLVCPALFDLGEAKKVVLLSVTEGDDKPLKYPEMFYQADILLITKIDLLPYVKFSVEKAIEYAKRLNTNITTIETSIQDEQGLKKWLDWLTQSYTVFKQSNLAKTT